MRRTSVLAAAAVLIGLAPALAQTQAPPTTANGRTQSSISGLKLSGDQPIQIESDSLEVREAENLAIFSGNVNVVQGETKLKSGRMTVFYAKGGGSAATGSSTIDRLEVQDNVYVSSKDQVATGDKGEFNMATEILTLSGREVVLSEGRNVLTGCRLTVQMKSGQAKVDGCGKTGGSGRVMMSIVPKSK